MAQRADQQRRAVLAVGIGGATDVPPEPAVPGVSDELGEDFPRPPGAKLDAAGPIGGSLTVRGCADRDVLDAVAVEIAGADDHARVQFTRLGSRPMTQLLA